MLKIILIDTLYAFKGTYLEIKNPNPPEHYTKSPTKKHQIVLLPGIFSKWGGMKKLADFISSNGYAVHVIKALGDELKDIPTSAKIVETYLRENQLKDVIFLSHSKGGIIGKYFLENHNQNQVVIGMISVATPFVGTSLARYFPFKRIREFDTKSDLIKSEVASTSQNNKIISIYARHDEADTLGGYLEGALENIELDVDGHIRIIFSDKLLKAVLASITKLSS